MHRIPLSEVPAQLLPLVSLIRQWVSSQGFSHATPTDCAALMVKTLVQKTHSVLATSAKFKLPSKSACFLFILCCSQEAVFCICPGFIIVICGRVTLLTNSSTLKKELHCRAFVFRRQSNFSFQMVGSDVVS